jgi:LuxR family maltose regulon positive regulatory protein
MLAGVSSRRGRLAQAEAALRSANEAIDASADSGRVASLAAVVQRDLARARGRAGGGDVLERPSEAESAVLRLLDTDLSVRQIAGELFISPNTVRSHTRLIYRKLGVNSREDAVARAQLLGLLAH